MSRTRAWLVHAPQEIATEVDKEATVAVGGDEGDLSQYKSVEALRHRYKSDDPNLNDRRIIVWAGNLWMFSKEMQKGDHVLTPIKATRTVLFGKIASNYIYDPSKISPQYPNVRAVEWVARVSRDDLSQPFRNVIGSFRTVCNIDNLIPEIEAILAGNKPKSTEPPEGDTAYHDEVQNRANEMIADILSKMDPYDFQDLVSSVIKAIGFNTEVSPIGPDGGIDITAYPDVFGFQTPRIKIQVKLRKGPAGAQEIQQLVGAAGHDESLFVSIGGFTQQALNESKKHPKLVLVDRDRFVNLLLGYYEKIDPESKALIPLRKIYVPTGAK